MAGKSTAQFVPSIEKSLLRKLQTSDTWLLNRTPENIDGFNKLLDSIPRNYTWHFTSAEAFRVIASSIKNTGRVSDQYRLYWEDIVGQIEAFSAMSAWRLAEIARSAVWATRREDVLRAAAMSRSALETAANYAWFQTKVRPAIERIARGDIPTLIPDLEDKLLKVVFASKRKDDEEFYRPTNIVTIIGHITEKIPGQEDMAKAYDALCEVAHPNWMGLSIYVTSAKTIDIPGHEARTISMSHGPTATEILRYSITALSWSTGTFSLSSVALQQSLGEMHNHLDRVSHNG